MTILLHTKLGFDITQAGTVVGLLALNCNCGCIFGGCEITDRFGFYHQQLVSLFSGADVYCYRLHADFYNALHQQFCT